MEYPRVLIVSPNPVMSRSGTGLTLGSLFGDWPPERLANFFVCGDRPPAGVCAYSWQDERAPWMQRLAQRAARDLLRGQGDDVVPGLRQNGGCARERVRCGVACRALADLLDPPMPQTILEDIRRFRPDLIYSLLWNFYGMRITEQASHLTQAPVVPHFMDDWPMTQYSQAHCAVLWRALVNCRLRRVLKRASIGLAISEAMAVEFSHRYGIAFEAFMRCVEPSEVRATNGRGPVSPLRLAYTGGLHLGRDRVLALVGAAAERCSLAGEPVVLTVYSPYEHEEAIVRDACRGISAVRWGGALSPESVPFALADSDVAVHVESFDARAVAYTRLSLSTKFPSYLAAALPVLAVGPGDVTPTRYVAEHAIGLTVTEPNVDKIARALSELMKSSVWRRLSENSYALCQQQHIATIVRDRFKDSLCRAAACSHRPGAGKSVV